MNPTSEYKLFSSITERENELITILIDSSLNRDKNPEDKEKLLQYLVSSYFKNLQTNSRVQPVVIQCVRAFAL
jgi:hypothetical protein